MTSTPVGSNDAELSRDAAEQATRDATDALLRLSIDRPQLAETMAGLITAVATEAGRTARFANALQAALAPSGAAGVTPARKPQRRTGRRDPGVLDPFEVYAEAGESGLRDRLGELDLEKLRDIVAEHGMDHDRLAMKWKDLARVINRIVEKVMTRAAKGSAFRSTND